MANDSGQPVGKSPVHFGTGDRVVEMEDSEVENLATSISSDVDAEFDTVIGHIEDIIMGKRRQYYRNEEFQMLQRHFMDKYYLEFENTEENKLSYTSIFQEYVNLLEKYIEQQLIERIPTFNMATFTTSLQQHKDEISGDIFDMLLTFTDFLAFKEMFLDYRMEKEGHGLDFSGDLIVTSLSKSSSLSPASNNLRHF
ncbi:ADP-ribosylation factor-like protein 2-binding protein isoform X1 [Leucoraja erinacea]|uniref:ADP-ribosylation factor-like protein 2-binding protein isoform X1 n=2 Tax=Leucoraja erinaceus TaxID=7782 RepID=UPI002455801C|nr:ADP-ribosylation factor-like protein 2-binding protein isoform X1 [Leucoraja erinacea]